MRSNTFNTKGEKSFSETLSMEREGIPAEVFLEYIKKLRIPSIRVFQMFNIPKSTAAHKIRTGGRFLGTAALAAIRLEKMLSMADRIISNSMHPSAVNFDTGQWLGEWIERPQPALGGLKPSELLDTETGAQRVFQVLAAVESGSYQ
jgi:uncharacterized protein (DUF2384 family)